MPGDPIECSTPPRAVDVASSTTLKHDEVHPTAAGTEEKESNHAATYSLPAPRKRVDHLIGLVNSGATCYLNSLLQSLYMTREFRELVFAWQPPPRKPPLEEGKEGEDPMKTAALVEQLATERATRLQRSVPYQLQMLFARLALSRERGAVSTEALTHSFGWANAELFRQHDVQELMRVLFTALERAWAPLSAVPSTADPKQQPAANPLADLYSGRLEDVIVCRSCHTRRSRVDTFQDLSLSLGSCSSLDQAIEEFTKVEQMEGENMLRCESDKCGGKKVEATKGLKLSELPQILTFQLKRFTFDFNLMQRTKVNGMFDFPQRLDMSRFMPDGSEKTKMQYELFGILMHSGVAVGGHYFAYLQSLSDKIWYEFNDAQVLELPGGLETAMKNARGSDSNLKGGSSAYMILYRRVDAATCASAPVPSADVSQLISTEIRECIEEEERKHAADAAIAERDRRTLSITIYRSPNQPPLHIQKDMTETKVRELATEILHMTKMCEHNLVDVRLRKYDPSLKWASTIYASDAEHTLEEASFPKQTILLLEVKKPEEQWAPYAADTVPLRCVFVTPSNVATLVEQSLHPVVSEAVFALEVSKSQTVLDLKKAIIAGTKQSVPSVGNQRIILMHETHCELLKDDSALLHSFDLYPGRFLYLEHSLEQEMVRPVFERTKCQIEICFNVPLETDVATAGKPTQPEYNQKLVVSRNDTLAVVKAKIGHALGLDVDTFRVARSHTAQQFKDDTETLADLQLVNQSGIYVSHGRPLKKDEVQCTFFLYQPDHEETAATTAAELSDVHPSSTPSLSTASSTASTASVSSATAPAASSPPVLSKFQYLFDLPIRHDMLLSDLKPHLLSCLSKKRPHPTLAHSNAWNIVHLRLRDKKGTQTTKVYEDGKSVQENLGAMKLEDGFEIVLQKLDHPEVWTSAQMMLQAQQWLPAQGKLGPVQDLVTRKNVSVGGMKMQLYKMVHGHAFVAPGSENVAADVPAAVEPTAAPAEDSATSIAASSDASVVYPAILLAKGKLTGKMKRSDMLKLAWSQDAGDSKLLRNALALRAGELMMWMEEVSQEEKAAIAAAKEKKKAAAAAAVAAAATEASTASNSTDSATSIAPAKAASAAVPAVARKPWQRGVVAGASRARKPGSSSSSNAVVSSRPAPREHAVHIGFSDEEAKWLADEEMAAAVERERKAALQQAESKEVAEKFLPTA